MLDMFFVGGSPVPYTRVMPIQSRWLTSAQRQRLAPQLATLFVTNVSPSYISHSEVWIGRALSADQWSPNLQRIILQEIRKLPQGTRVAVHAQGSELLGLAMVRRFGKVAVLEDLVMQRTQRRSGHGSTFLAWIKQDLALKGCTSLYLESGLKNHGAHRFFKRNAFRPVSVQMACSLV
jgi:GNAT superfamily N-acetyltransferase